LFAGLITLLIVGGVALASGGAMFSPGALSKMTGDGQVLSGVTSHAQIDRDCARCHIDPWSSEVMATRCMNCHTDIRAQLADPQSLHNAFPNINQCRTCHSEHNGPAAALTQVSAQDFPHERLKFTLAAHQKRSDGQPFTCADCHGDNVAKFDRARCEACHRGYQADFVAKHVADFGSDCLACHDGVDRYSKFDHNRLKFTLAGKHVEITCGECHRQVRAVADFKGASPACIDCHRKDDKHNGSFGVDCAKCHTAESWAGAQFDHNLAAFQLTGQHLKVRCDQCHTNNVFKGTPQTCVACHQRDDKHQGKFGTDCAQCHTAENWQDAKFDHNLAAFKLEGKHQTVECAKCHVNNVFQGTPQTCIACHQKDDKHAGAFGTDCAACHNPSNWADAKFDHNLSTFKLTGAHVSVQCSKCHVNNVFKGTPQTCVSCHAEPQQHLGAFGTDCVQCHSTTTWRGATFNHAFPLNHGESGNIPCQTCHVTANFKEYTCYGCHAHDPARIEARHVREGISNFQDCVRCHATGRREGGGD